MAPVSDSHCLLDGSDGVVGQRNIDLSIETCKGTVALIISMAFESVEAVTRYGKNGLLIWDTVTMESLKGDGELAEFVHPFGIRILFQGSPGLGKMASGDITTVPMLPSLEPDVDRVMLLDRLEEGTVRIRAGRQVVKIANSAPTVVGENKQSGNSTYPPAAVVVGMRPEKSLRQGLVGEPIVTREIWDYKHACRIHDEDRKDGMVAFAAQLA